MTNSYWNGTLTLSDGAKRYQDEKSITAPYENNPLDLTLFVSCYNEEAFITGTLNTIVDAMQIVGKTYEIIVIDDCSKDHSVQLVQDYIREHPDINIILRVNHRNKGLAQNFIDGAFIGRGKYYRLICGDNAEPIDTIVKVLSRIGEADIIIPYYVEAQGKSGTRQLISKTYTKIINALSGHRLHYYNGLHVHLRLNIMRWHPTTRGFGFQALLLCTLFDLGFTYVEVPCVTIELRGGGGNALNWKNLRSVMHTMLSVLMRRVSPWT